MNGMSESTKTILKFIGYALLIYFGYKIVVATTILILKLLVPIAIVGGVGYLIYRSSGGKALTGGRKTLP